ncbi:MAG: GAF domain-containing sensor histidine kinase [Candidatus Nitronauta litoralis]|uniref:GAF domain-containing sensor histidine kinase n=1 Tax=Candidatus Nitronauta litoralis TaxID=2705533 RepID=A0A7T0BYQ8_9BACT|nr:MAG: GAF domain-containing sensor histidine kinase [Candidatus Nitronauta litoralis]
MAFTFLYLDMLLPLGIAGGMPYIALILVGMWAISRKLIFFNAILGSVFTIAGFFLSPFNTDETVAAFNRGLTVATLWLTVYFSLMNLRLLEEKERSDLLEKANKQIEEESGYVELSRDIALFTNLSRSLGEAIEYSLRKICNFTGWPVGHLFLIGEDNKTLYPAGIWYLENEKKFKNFQEVTKKSRLEPGEGLPGRVMADGKSHFIFDLQSDLNFPRAGKPDQIEVASGLGFPIMIGDRTVGVMEFFSSDHVKPSERLMEVMDSIGVLLGRILERTRAEEAKEKHNIHLRQLYKRLDSIREEESRRMAREVHDNLGQVLTSLKIELSLLENILPEKKPAVDDSIKMMFNLIEKNIEVVRKISRELRPPVLDSLGIVEAINWQGTTFQEKTGVKFFLTDKTSKCNLDIKRSTTIFRIFQECLTNIVRHAEASEVHVDFYEDSESVIMQVRDNGQGINGHEVNSITSLGLLGMKERAEIWGGDFTVFGGSSQGTTVKIKIPKGS